MTSSLSYLPSTAKLRSAISLKDKLAVMFNLAVLFACYPFYHTTRFRAVPQVLYRILLDYRVKVDGITFVMPGNYPVEATLINEDYEPEVRKIVLSFKEGVFVDCGVGLGLYTLLSSKAMGKRGTVVSLEPDPLMCEHTWMSVNENRCENVIFYPYAAWSSTTKMKLYDNYLTRLASSLIEGSKPNRYANHYDEVETVMLDDIIPEGSPLLLKVDVEGAEPEVFKGAKKNLMRDDVTVIFEALDLAALAKSRAVLEPMGFTITPLVESDGRNYVASRT